MTTPAVSILEDAILELEPIDLPPQRRLLIGLMLALTIFLHVATIGWGPIENNPAGFNAAVSREVSMGIGYPDLSKNWDEFIAPNLEQRLTALSFQIFGISEWAARLPGAVANLLIVWMVFSAGEKMGGMWRGLVSGIIAATTTGVILHGRDSSEASLTALLFMISFFAVLRMLRQRSRLGWQILFWVAVGSMLLAGKPAVALISLLGPLLSLIFFREARIRLRIWWFIGCSLIALLLAGAIFFKGHDVVRDSATLWNGRVLDIGWTFFPWSALVFLPLFLQIRKVARFSEFGAEDAVFWCSTVSFFIAATVFSPSLPWSENVACLWPMFALVAGLTWERATAGWRIVGISVLIILALAGMIWCDRMINLERLRLLRPILWMSCSVLAFFGVSAIVSLKLRHSRAAFLMIAASVIPLSFNLLDAESRFDWQRSMKNLGDKLSGDFRNSNPVIVDEPLRGLGSFLFYSPHGIRFEQRSRNPTSKLSRGSYFLYQASSAEGLPDLEIVGRNRTHTLARIHEL